MRDRHALGCSPDQHATELVRVATARRHGRRWSTRKHARARVPAVPSNQVLHDTLQFCMPEQQLNSSEVLGSSANRAPQRRDVATGALAFCRGLRR